MMTRRAAMVLLFALTDCHDQGAHEHGGLDDSAFQGCPEDVPPFALDMEATGEQGRIRARVVAAMPEPPLRYLNDWTVLLLDAQGSRLGDAKVVKARPFMPVHGHDGNRDPRVVPVQGQPGMVELRELNFIMRGPWEVQLTVSSPQAGDDYLVFPVCVQE